MKAFVVLLAVLALVWLLNGSRRRRRPDPPPTARNTERPAAAPPALAVCAHCGVYLPHDEALPGRGGSFCGAAHRAAHEAAARAP